MENRKAAELALVALSTALLWSAPRPVSGLGLNSFPENQSRPENETPAQDGGRWTAPPCTGFFDLFNGPEGGRLPARPGTGILDLTPAGSGFEEDSKATASIELRSPAVGYGAHLPASFTCEGPGASPPLEWIGVPSSAAALALIVADPDSAKGAFTHWVLYDLPPSAGSLSQGMPPGPSGPLGSKQGRNDLGRLGWSGPCPSCGLHRYEFKLYALSAATGLAAGASADQLLKAMKGKIIGRGELIIPYQRAASQAPRP
jgi:Raf kinase inhibitor-like YbhB/YbcL family protein